MDNQLPRKKNFNKTYFKNFKHSHKDHSNPISEQVFSNIKIG
jgi:hypothetical protein